MAPIWRLAQLSSFRMDARFLPGRAGFRRIRMARRQLRTGKSSMRANGKNYFRAPTVCAASLFLVLPFIVACGSHAAEGTPQAVAPPDLNGVWSAPFTPDISKTLGHQPPFTPY